MVVRLIVSDVGMSVNLSVSNDGVDTPTRWLTPVFRRNELLNTYWLLFTDLYQVIVLFIFILE